VRHTCYLAQVKEKVYDSLVGLEIEGYPCEADPDFKETNINDLVILSCIPYCVVSDGRLDETYVYAEKRRLL
jgi:hypothetical protein